jgi:hypothetical protein
MNRKEAAIKLGCTYAYISQLIKSKKIRCTPAIPAIINDDDINNFVLLRENKKNDYVTKEELKENVN